jgi:hypothetical protein
MERVTVVCFDNLGLFTLLIVYIDSNGRRKLQKTADCAVFRRLCTSQDTGK